MMERLTIIVAFAVAIGRLIWLFHGHVLIVEAGAATGIGKLVQWLSTGKKSK